MEVLDWITRHCKNFILSIPIGTIEFDSPMENPAEQHLSSWSAEELKGWYKAVGHKSNAGQINTYWFKYTKEILINEQD